MLTEIPLGHILFIDIETAPIVYQYSDLDVASRLLWDKKMRWQMERNETTAEELYQKAGIYAEFARVVCVSAGFFAGANTFRITSYIDKDETVMLKQLAKLLGKYFNSGDQYLCAHNGKEFDFPFLARRYLINNMELPYTLDLAGKKPWEVQHLDTMQLWKFGDYKHFTSLELLTHIFDIPSPKSDIDGSDVARVFWEDQDYKTIRDYCEQDVIALARLVLKWKGKLTLENKQIVFVR